MYLKNIQNSIQDLFTFYVSLSKAHVNIRAMISGVPKMKTFRSATTLCIPDPTFNDITRHRLCLPQGSPVQRELLTGNYNDIPLLMFYRRDLGMGSILMLNKYSVIIYYITNITLELFIYNTCVCLQPVLGLVLAVAFLLKSGVGTTIPILGTSVSPRYVFMMLQTKEHR